MMKYLECNKCVYHNQYLIIIISDNAPIIIIMPIIEYSHKLISKQHEGEYWMSYLSFVPLN